MADEIEREVAFLLRLIFDTLTRIELRMAGEFSPRHGQERGFTPPEEAPPPISTASANEIRVYRASLKAALAAVLAAEEI